MTDYLSPHLASSALLLIDVQNDFLDGGAAPIPGTSAVLPKLAELAAAYREGDLAVVHLVRLYQPGDSDVDLVRRDRIERGEQLVAPGSAGADLPASLLPDDTPLDAAALRTGAPQVLGEQEVVFFKPRWSAFHRTELEGWLRNRALDTIVVAGCNLPNCPRATLFDATERDFRSVLVVDAVSQLSDERLTDLEAIGVRLLQTRHVVDQLVQELRTEQP
ncbi:LOW QUALITY PROTEIN: nicotinamidase-related amidase [Propionibacteriaceae bacterium ES.041]|nr:LOW QUALITY PROTEIN: nicotinamidase-related amidase [Propionibacteriaceae bacterium ES.041]